tara:strand:+ start:292 stop:465 length:174 start_codon:yes stop_codon:yes gene_type:complete
MCLICAEIKKDKLTHKEARRNLGELRHNITKEHILEVLKLIWKKEDEEGYKYWHGTD